ncbi:MAG: hypothetical protein HY716_05415 [Planctomycetes bacterium]|nr:hypothetical protein [Planctomycetota bacterium]
MGSGAEVDRDTLPFATVSSLRLVAVMMSSEEDGMDIETDVDTFLAGQGDRLPRRVK